MVLRAHKILAAIVVTALSLAAVSDTAAAVNNTKPNTHQANPKSKNQSRG